MTTPKTSLTNASPTAASAETDAEFVERMAGEMMPSDWPDGLRLIALARSAATPNAAFDQAAERQRYEAEEARCVARVLDDHGVPTENSIGGYSLVGRVMEFARRSAAIPPTGAALPDEVLEAAWSAMGPVTMTGTGNMEAAIKAAMQVLVCRGLSRAALSAASPISEGEAFRAEQAQHIDDIGNRVRTRFPRITAALKRSEDAEAASEPSRDARADGWQPIATAPKDGTLVLLLIAADDDREAALEDSEGATITVGANNDDNVGEGEGVGWQFAGWNWCQDCYCEGSGNPTHWQQLPPAPGAAS